MFSSQGQSLTNIYTPFFVATARNSLTTATSTDGITWTRRDTLSNTTTWDSITYGGVNGPSKWVATSTGDVTSRSLDGINWTVGALPAGGGGGQVVYGGGRFVAIKFGDTQTSVSTDGINWGSGTLPTSAEWTSIAYGNGVWVATAGVNGPTNYTFCARSTDGVTWTQPGLPQSGLWRVSAYGNGTFVILSANNNRAATSTDGNSWVLRTVTSQAWGSLVFGGGLFVALPDGGTTDYSTSPDGITWTDRVLPVTGSWLTATYGNGLFVAIDSTNPSTRALTSPDGINWTQRTLPVSAEWQGVSYGATR